MLGAPGEGSLAGDGLAFLCALAFAVMVVITRWRHDVSMAPATCLSQVILVVVFLPFATPGEIGGDDLGWLAALGIGQIGLGFALLTVGARLIPAAQVGPDHAARGRARPALGVARAGRAPEHAHARRRRDRDRRDRHANARGAGSRAVRLTGSRRRSPARSTTWSSAPVTA